MKNWIRKQFRKKTRVYILPTQMGGYLWGLLFVMFLLSIGYNNNLLLIFTLFLFSFNLLWLVQSHFHLYRLKLKNVVMTNGHAQDGLPLKIFWESSPKTPVAWKVSLEKNDQGIESQIFEHSEEFSAGEIKLPARGLWEWKYLKVSSVQPFGLYRIWCFFPLNLSTFSYPALIDEQGSINQREEKDGDQFSTYKSGPEDFWSFAPYQGEEARKISWKQYARTGELFIKEGEELGQRMRIISLEIPELQKEKYLSAVATQMVQCHRNGIPFILQGPNGTIGPAATLDHLHQSLRELSLC